LVAAPLIEITEFAVGDAAVARLQVGILPLPDLDKFDGLLGMNFLQQFASSIDQQQGLLHLDEKS
jgi:predicted aspartyl protease